MFRSAIQKGKFESRASLIIALAILAFLIITDLGVFAKNDSNEYGWFPLTNQPNDEFTAVTMKGETNIWITSATGKVYYSDLVNGTYTILLSAGKRLNDIVFKENLAVVVGDQGYVAFSTDGMNWTIATGIPTTSNLLAVEVQSPHIWVTGENSTIIHSIDFGNTWEIQDTPTSTIFRGVGFMNETTGWLVGDSGTILSTTDAGNTWEIQNSGTLNNLNDIVVDTISSPRIYIVGENGAFLMSWGASLGINFNLMPTETQNSLYSVYSPKFGVIWAAGAYRTILGSWKQATEFTLQVLDTSDVSGEGDFMGIFIVNDIGIAVGKDIFYTQTGGGLIPKYEVIDPWQDIAFYTRQAVPRLIEGMFRAVQVVVIALSIGFFLGLTMATFRTVNNRVLNVIATTYSDLFRNTPLLVQLTFIAFGLPELGYNPPIFWDGVIAFSLNTGAYQSEIIRSGIQAIPKGQMEAARSLGMSNFQAMRYIILPQAVRITIPPLANESVNMFLNSSLLSTIGFEDATRVGAIIAAQSFLWARTFLYVAVTYFVVTYTITRTLRRMERKLRIPGLGGGELA